MILARTLVAAAAMCSTTLSTGRWLLAAGLAAHGIAHTAGFAVAWRLTASVEIPYHTTLLNGRFDVGDGGARGMGVLWLVAGLGFLVSAVLVATRAQSAVIVIATVSLVSLVLCVLEWPFSRVGLMIDACLVLALPIIGALDWNDRSQEVARSLRAARRADVAATESTLDALPVPVARYLSRVLPKDHRRIRAVTLQQDAQFFVAGAWKQLYATQQYSIAPAGFLWDARIAMMPLMHVYVRDAYVNGRGSMRADFLAVYPVVRQAARPELDAGALHRYLAEAVWFPMALLPSAGVSWEPVDDRAAKATLTDGHTVVSLEFRFNEAGDVTEIFTPARFAETNGHYEPRPWLVRCSDYESHDGVRIPVQCEVAWQLPSGSQPYWRGRVTSVSYDSAVQAG